jgi:MarR family transcriptional regulator, negative regulator of the multidrug operon emrRAB
VPNQPTSRLSNLLGALSLAVADQIREATEQAAGVSDAGPAALVSLRESPSERTIEELRLLVGLTHSGGVRLVDRLSDLGYVTRRLRPPGRSVVVTLTPDGVAAADRIERARAEVLDRAIRSLSESEQDLLASTVSTVISDIARDRLARRAAGRPPQGGALCRMCDFTACGRDFGRCPAQAAAATLPSRTDHAE